MADSNLKSPRNTPELETRVAAYDAAARAVCLIVYDLGMRKGGISLLDGANLLPRKNWNRATAENAAISLLCGVLARRKRWPEVLHAEAEAFADRYVRGLLKDYTSSEPELNAYVRQMELSAERFVYDETVWFQVQTIARELVRHLRITREEIVELMEQACRKR